MKNDIGIKIKNLRKEKGYTLQQLGELAGVYHSAIAKYENGTVTNIPIERLTDLAKILGVNVSYFVEDKHTQSRINNMFITPPPKVEIEEDVKAKIDVIIAVYEQCFGVLTNEKKSILNYVIFSFYDAQK